MRVEADRFCDFAQNDEGWIATPSAMARNDGWSGDLSVKHGMTGYEQYEVGTIRGELLNVQS